MGWLLWGGLLVLLLLSYVNQRQNITKLMWLTIVAVYLVCNVYVNLFGLLVPVGVIIAFVYMKKAKKPILTTALIFGLICVISTFYVPKISWSQLKAHSQDIQYSAEFNQVNAVYHFSADSEIHELLSKSALALQDKNPQSEINIEDPHVLFSLWVLSHQGLPMTDLDWLWYKAPLELHYYWQSSRFDELTNKEYIQFRDVGYMGVFTKSEKNSPYKLQAVYEYDRLKMNNPIIP
ncbi:hypothetical protein HQN90_27900 [Paenibacillus alba]|uniref:hypothetical protein n=1 Tax=Paenibacillus alba TaxID=1197127 RepID=UPI00156651EC|nr:hypothetical protein [Paenibacillus alba]NQX69963.1 hypothetical protein [Paenibacillus alba]